MPNQYPEEAWYHYDDWTCDYECMAIEYFYWCEVSYMGILDDIQTCNGIDNEWELCTPELFQSTDILMYELISDLSNFNTLSPFLKLKLYSWPFLFIQTSRFFERAFTTDTPTP